MACPIVIEHVHGLKLSSIDAYFQKTIFYQSGCDDKILHGFLVALANQGIIFVNGCDKHDERRFTIAHELAHFLVERLYPRDVALKAWGIDIVEAIDGARAITLEERLKILISNNDFSSNTHLLEKDDSSGTSRIAIWQAETVADKLALEILAPYSIVCESVRECGITKFSDTNALMLSTILVSKYGLPKSIAHGYAIQLLERIYGGPSFFEEWGIPQ